MEAPKTVIDAMTSTASAEVTWIDDGFAFYGPNDGIRMHRAPSFAEWTAASCGTFTFQDQKLYIDLLGRQGDRELSSQESRAFSALFDKQGKVDRCEHRLVSSNRDKLPPP